MGVKWLLFYLQHMASFTQEFREQVINYLANLKVQLFAILDKACRTTIYNCDRYDPANENFVAPSDNQDFYFHKLSSNMEQTQFHIMERQF